MEFGSFKDFIESTGDEELMDLYIEGLELKDMSKLERRLKEKGYQPGDYAQGGRVLKQTGGITETRQLPPEFIVAAQKTFLADLTRQAGLPSVTTATTQQPGETAEQFAARQAQAQQFGITRAGMAEVAPQVAP